MSWVAIVSTVVTVGGTVYAANQAGEAAQANANAATQSGQLSAEAQERFEERMQPYIAQGNAADYYINGLLGLPVGANGSGTSTRGGGMSERELRAAYPDLAAQWDGWERAGNSATNGHRTLYGNFEGYIRAARGFEATQRPETPTTPEDAATTAANTTAARNAAMAAYEASPWAIHAAESANTARANANESFTSTAGARGSVVSGRTAAGLYEIAQEAEDQRFREGFTEGWYPSITAQSDRGYNAAVGVGNSSLSTAAQVGAATRAAAAANANGQDDQTDIIMNGVNAAMYYGGQVYDRVRNGGKKSTPKSSVGAGGGLGGTSVYSGG